MKPRPSGVFASRRPCFVNHRTTDADVLQLLELARATGLEILAESR